MNRDEFEKAYAEKYLKSDLERSSHDTLLSMIENRDGEGYTDHHIDLCWKVQQVKDVPMGRNCIGDTIIKLAGLEW